jgi:predicted nucleic acid-binding protein
MVNYYIDTCIWRDYWEDRNDGLKPLGEFAFRFLKEIAERNDTIIVSNIIVDELGIKYSFLEIVEIFDIIPKNNLMNVSLSESQLKEAKKLFREVSFADILHAVIARDNNAILVTRDKHYDLLRDIAEIQTPENLL